MLTMAEPLNFKLSKMRKCGIQKKKIMWVIYFTGIEGSICTSIFQEYMISLEHGKVQ